MTNAQRKINILSLKAHPIFLETVSNRTWKEWWEKKGKTQQDVTEGLLKALEGKPCYDGFVAVQNETYLGSALVIKSDMEARPNYTPWVAAVFVEKEYRSQGIGSSLVQHAAQNIFEHGEQSVYLCATKKNSPYYEKLGWATIEENVGDDRLTIFIKPRPAKEDFV